MNTAAVPSLKLKSEITAYARSLGFSRLGIASAQPLKEAQAFLQTWLQEGRAGEMAYLERNPAFRARPEEHLPGARSVISLAMPYFNTRSGREPPAGGKIARYAWGKEYHQLIRKRLAALVRYLDALDPDVRCKTFIDTGPLLERAFAQKSGLGFVGKNTMLITKGLGSWVFLAMVITTLDLPEDRPDTRSCGSCTRCIDACPTAAITAPYQLDARRCISYLTIELKGSVEAELKPKVGDWLFGCDICQDVCPHNTRVPETPIQQFQPSGGVGEEIDLSAVLGIRSEAEFENHFSGTPLKRSQRHGLVRNACLVAANTRRTDLLPQLQQLAESDPHPVVRETATWAVGQLTAHS